MMLCETVVVELTVEGLLLLDKPSGPTSHDMVASVRKMCGGAKAGHTGTLDPLAIGLLVILVGRATKLAPFIPGDPKVYEGTILLGISTNSMDMEGEVISEGVFGGGTDEVGEAFASLVGDLEQVPPMFSAVKYRGSPLYHFARRGEKVPRKSRKVRIYRSEMTAFRPAGRKAEVDFIIECSPGTYIRELADRVGDMLGCGGTLSRLRRTASGPFSVEHALSVEEISACLSGGGHCLLPLDVAVEGYKRAEVADAWLKAARNGATLEEMMIETGDKGMVEGDTVAVFAERGLMGIHRVVATNPLSLRPLRIL